MYKMRVFKDEDSVSIWIVNACIGVGRTLDEAKEAALDIFRDEIANLELESESVAEE